MTEWRKQKLLEEAKQIAENYDPYSPYSSGEAIDKLLNIIDFLVTKSENHTTVIDKKAVKKIKFL